MKLKVCLFTHLWAIPAISVKKYLFVRAILRPTQVHNLARTTIHAISVKKCLFVGATYRLTQVLISEVCGNPCDQCEKKFIRRGDLKTHKRT